MVNRIGPDNVRHIYTNFDIWESFWKDGFIDYVGRNGIEIQSKMILDWGELRKYSSRMLGKRWEECLGLLMGADSRWEIVLANLFGNFRGAGVTKERRASIIKTLQGIVSVKIHDEATNEAFFIGLGMIFNDTLDWSDAESLVHLYRDQVLQVMDDPKEPTRYVVNLKKSEK